MTSTNDIQFKKIAEVEDAIANNRNRAIYSIALAILLSFLTIWFMLSFHLDTEKLIFVVMGAIQGLVAIPCVTVFASLMFEHIELVAELSRLRTLQDKGN